MHLAPLFKAGKYPHLPSSRRPISMTCTRVKILETITFHRFLETIETQLSLSQYAYREGGRAAILLLEMTERIDVALISGKYVGITSFDIVGAFDHVPHGQ